MNPSRPELLNAAGLVARTFFVDKIDKVVIVTNYLICQICQGKGVTILYKFKETKMDVKKIKY